MIGVSHSKHHIVIGHSLNCMIGVDIENYTEKVLRVAAKFMSDIEISRFGISDLQILTTIWSIKEAVFKMRYKDHLVFRDQIEVLEINKSGKIRIKCEEIVEEISFEIIELEEAVITFCLAKN
ncbi:4-phosphopantetheinyl transferase family protein [Crocinitomix catalasitica]|nr:4-phosphopantetheinyl transferase family protein [Crocinitomix catalasitica]